MLMTLDEACARTKGAARLRSAMITDARQADGPIIYCTQNFLTLTGYAAHEVIGRNPRFLQGPETDPAAVSAIGEALALRQPISVDILNYRKDGTPFWNRLMIRPSFDGRGDLEHFIGAQIEIEASKVRHQPVSLRLI